MFSSGSVFTPLAQQLTYGPDDAITPASSSLFSKHLQPQRVGGSARRFTTFPKLQRRRKQKVRSMQLVLSWNEVHFIENQIENQKNGPLFLWPRSLEYWVKISDLYL